MWTSHIKPLTNGSGIHTTLEQSNKPLSYADVISHWQHSTDFRTFFINVLSTAPFEAFRWETPPITRAIAQRPFECVLLDSKNLIREADRNTFAEHFQQANQASVIAFSNLGNDAQLIVPCPTGHLDVYPHIGAFIRHAPDTQKHTLWQQVGIAVEHRLNDKPVWLSTAGEGVSWLHVRLDNYPKYYRHAPYRDIK